MLTLIVSKTVLLVVLMAATTHHVASLEKLALKIIGTEYKECSQGHGGATGKPPQPLQLVSLFSVPLEHLVLLDSIIDRCE